MGILFITGIDTGIGKTYATGLLARFLLQQGKSVITQKIIQTGCEHTSEDIILHRKIMGINFTEEDKKNLTNPYIFTFPSSPHLAARRENVTIDTNTITTATEILAKKYDHVLIEGVGGIMVPLTDEITLLDYISERLYPILIISSSRLGSINHTLMTIEILKNRNLEVRGIIYNQFPKEKREIIEDSKSVFKKFLYKYDYPAVVIDMPLFDFNNIPEIDFSYLLI